MCCCSLGPAGGCFLQGNRAGRKYGVCLIKAHQSSSGGILEQSKGPVYFELVCTWKLKQVKSKCQFKVWLIKEQKRQGGITPS